MAVKSTQKRDQETPKKRQKKICREFAASGKRNPYRGETYVKRQQQLCGSSGY
jgi:hypothetical protein